jgi:hypothetical protein
MRQAEILTLIAASLTALGCSRPTTQPEVSDSTFVAVMSELRRIETDTSLDSTMRDSMRKVTLRQRSLTPEALERAARALANEPERAVAVWRSIERHVNKQPLKPTR